MIAIIDYQMGNLRSVQKAFERLGHSAEITGDPQRIAGAEKLVLPGVGAFRDAINELRVRRLVPVIEQSVAEGKPFLGICLGMQLLFDVSFEDGEHRGLGIIPGKVVRFDLPHPYKVPHMGWNQVRAQRPVPLLEGIPQSAYFYFVHSYYVVPEDRDCVALQTDYGVSFCSMIWRERLFATQFHPEKSQQHGLQLLRRFAEL
jgi:glutamine amidotransferase